MPVSEPGHAAATWSNRAVWAVIVVLTLLFAGLTVYRIRARDLYEENTEKIAELSTAAAKPIVLPAGYDWPQWRGPNRDGTSSESGLLATWPEDGPKLLWSQRIGDGKRNGYSSVAVARGRAITMIQDGDDEAVVCWDAASGKELWRFRYPAHFRHFQFGDGPRSTPAIAGDVVFTVGGTGIIHCFKLEPATSAGAVVWRKNLLEEFGSAPLEWGVSFSPLVEKGLVYVMPGGPNGKSLAALNAYDGRVVWQAFDDKASYSSPVAADLAGQRQIVFLTSERLIGITPDTGKLLWEYPWPSGPAHTPSSIGTPLVIHREVGDYLFIASGYDKGCALIKIERDGDGCRANQVYRKSTMRSVFSSAVCSGDSIYGFDDANFVCIDLRNGKRHWKAGDFGKGNVVLADGRLIIHGAEGQLALAAADSAAYRELSRFEHTQQRQTWTPPSVADGRLFVRDWSWVKCYDIRKSP